MTINIEYKERIVREKEWIIDGVTFTDENIDYMIWGNQRDTMLELRKEMPGYLCLDRFSYEQRDVLKKNDIIVYVKLKHQGGIFEPFEGKNWWFFLSKVGRYDEWVTNDVPDEDVGGHFAKGELQHQSAEWQKLK